MLFLSMFPEICGSRVTLFKMVLFYFMCLNAWSTCVSVHYMCARCQRSEGSFGAPGVGTVEGWEEAFVSCLVWVLGSNSVPKQVYALLTTKASVQAQ